MARGYGGLKGSKGARKTGTGRGGRSPYSSVSTGNKSKRSGKRYASQLGTVQVYK